MTSTNSENTKKEIHIAIGVRVDAVAGWPCSYEGADSPGDTSRGMFAGEVGALRLFEQQDIQASWFIPGHSIETFAAQIQPVADAGHEIGHPQPPHMELELNVAREDVMA